MAWLGSQQEQQENTKCELLKAVVVNQKLCKSAFHENELTVIQITCTFNLITAAIVYKIFHYSSTVTTICHKQVTICLII
jgi:hypothetical protein